MEYGSTEPLFAMSQNRGSTTPRSRSLRHACSKRHRKTLKVAWRYRTFEPIHRGGTKIRIAAYLSAALRRTPPSGSRHRGVERLAVADEIWL
jgi:hypothetical protein